MLYVVNRRATTTPPSLLSLIGASKQERRGRGEERIMRMEGMEEEEVHFLASCPLFFFAPFSSLGSKGTRRIHQNSV